MSSEDRLRRGYESAARALLNEATTAGTWEGELSSSPLSTATAVAALLLVMRQQPERGVEIEPLICGGLSWLVAHQNADGGWGDTVLSQSNISTTTLAYASFHLAASATTSSSTARDDSMSEAAARAKSYFEQHGGFEAIRKRYGKDHTFSVPILTQCALAGLIPWRELTPLPFELGCLPHWFYRWIRLPVVSYALPALIAIGQVRHHHAPSWNPLVRWIRRASVAPTLRKLESIQPESGGFLEATPLTSFVTMSLASMGLSDHPVARLGVRFLKDSVRSDGSWPIDITSRRGSRRSRSTRWPVTRCRWHSRTRSRRGCSTSSIASSIVTRTLRRAVGRGPISQAESPMPTTRRERSSRCSNSRLIIRA